MDKDDKAPHSESSDVAGNSISGGSAKEEDLRMAIITSQIVQWQHILGKFEGKPHHDRDYKHIADMVRWGNQEKLACTKFKLKGQGLTAIKANPQMSVCANWYKFIIFIRNNYQSSFFNCLQKLNEKITEYTTLLHLVGSRIVAHGPLNKAMFEENVLVQFLKGIKSSIQHFVLSRLPRICEQAVTFAKEEEQTEQMTGKKPYAQVVIRHTEAQCFRRKNLNKIVPQQQPLAGEAQN
ncbi:hypothetical protein PR048_011826 [Dryococelus australis]|uniref:Uncharacterized protein n=1 Tax=Dryococelus australis TaxID=614101 RepID=A0ABQ9HMR0_9NEOP|nr:hypothetical protein PR048_011826 [Dryococelus australis]